MCKGRMSPGFRKQVVRLEAEQLRARPRRVREVGLQMQPPFVGYRGRGEGEEVAGFEVVALFDTISYDSTKSQVWT